MLQIDNYIFSLDLLDKKFICDLPQCQGNCCRYGDSGAPLTEEEALTLKNIKEQIYPFLSGAGKETIDVLGTSIKDFEGEMVTPLIKNEECAYTVLEGNVLKCGIEKAWAEGKTVFRKPVSCHLFPVRMKRFSDFTAVNYQELSICAPARKKGHREGVYVYEFLKESLIRAVGDEVYGKLCIAAETFLKKG